MTHSFTVWFSEFCKYQQWGKFAASFGHAKTKRHSALGGFAPLTPTGALPPGPPLGAPTQIPVIGSRSTLAMEFEICAVLNWSFKKPWQTDGQYHGVYRVTKNEHNMAFTGSWYEWNPWSSCSLTCGAGSRSRYRKPCNTSVLGSCPGTYPTTEVESCNQPACPRTYERPISTAISSPLCDAVSDMDKNISIIVLCKYIIKIF